MPTARPRDAPRSFPGVPLKPWTYRTLAYNLLAVPLGFVYVLVLVTGAALTVGVGLTLAGPVFLLLTLLSVVALAHAAGRLTGGLLDVEVDPPFPDDGTAVGFLKQFVLGRATWAGVVYLLCRSVLWLVTFVGLVVGLSASASLLAAPLGYGEYLVVFYGAGAVAVDSLVRAPVAAVAGVLVGLVALHLSNLLGATNAAADALLAPE
jgi:hypothetical protein